MAVHVTRAGVALTVGIILVTGLIIGGLLWAKNSGEQARRDEAIKVAEQNLEKNSDQGVALNKGDEQSGSKSGEQSNNNSSQSSQSTGTNQSTKQQGTGTSEQSQATELPQTGPADTLMSLMVIAVISFTVASYIVSLRQRHI